MQGTTSTEGQGIQARTKTWIAWNRRRRFREFGQIWPTPIRPLTQMQSRSPSLRRATACDGGILQHVVIIKVKDTQLYGNQTHLVAGIALPRPRYASLFRVNENMKKGCLYDEGCVCIRARRVGREGRGPCRSMPRAPLTSTGIRIQTGRSLLRVSAVSALSTLGSGFYLYEASNEVLSLLSHTSVYAAPCPLRLSVDPNLPRGGGCPAATSYEQEATSYTLFSLTSDSTSQLPVLRFFGPIICVMKAPTSLTTIKGNFQIHPSFDQVTLFSNSDLSRSVRFMNSPLEFVPTAVVVVVIAVDRLVDRCNRQ